MRALLVLAALLLAGCAAAAQAPREPSMADARAVCRAVAAGRATFLDVSHGDSGGPRVWSALDIDNDGAAEDLAITVGGSSGTPWIQLRRDPPGRISIESQFEGGGETYAPWSGQLELVRHRGRIYEVFYSDSLTHDYPVYVAIHLPDGAGRWVCGFESAAPVPDLRALRIDAAPICDAIEQRQGSAAEDFPFTPMPEEARDFDRVARARGTVDFMNDGSPRALELLDWSSGAGAGCGAAYFDLSDPQGSEDVLLAALQTKTELDEAQTYPFRLYRRTAGCHGNLPRFHRINGVVVFEQRFPGARPQFHDEEFWWVSRVENGQVVPLCEAREFTATPLTIKYNSDFYPQAR